MKSTHGKRSMWARGALAGAAALLLAQGAAAQQAEGTLPEVRVLDTAEQAWKQAPGVSTITAEDLQTPPAGDLTIM